MYMYVEYVGVRMNSTYGVPGTCSTNLFERKEVNLIKTRIKRNQGIWDLWENQGVKGIE